MTVSLRRNAWLPVLAGLAYLALLLWRFRTVPDGLVNDTAEESLRGLLLLEQHRLEVLTLVLGNSAETLWLYVVGVSSAVLGPTVLAVVLPSALAAAATAALVTGLVRVLDPEVPWGVPFLLAVGSPWLFHYGRSGLRTIAAPLFLALTALLLARAARDPGRRWPFALAGASAAASVYAYTSCRLVPVALGLALATECFRDRERRRDWLHASGFALAGLAVVSLPNLFYLTTHPREFLTRGGYVVVGPAGERVRNLVATIALPFDYPHRYRFIWGEAHVFDGVSAGLTGSGLDPVPLAVGLLFAVGLVWRLIRRRDVTTLFLAFLLALAIAVLGPAGPSLTRLLVVVPVYVVFASFGVGALSRRPWIRKAFLAGLSLLAAATLVRYFTRLSDPARESREYNAASQTAMGERARAASRDGPVLCVVTESANVVRYLAHGTPVTVVEFYQRPFDPRAAEPDSGVRTVFVETQQRLEGWTPPGFVEVERGPLFRVLLRS